MMRIGLFLSYLLVVPAIFGLIGRITEKPPNKQLSNRIENQAKSLLTLLHRSAQFGHMEIVKALIEAGVDLNTQTNYGYTPLHLAADNGHKEVVEALIEAGAKVNTQDIKGDTPLHKAALRGNTEIVRALMLERADPDIKNNFELTPLDYASLHSSLEVFTKQQELRLKRNKY
ncbi:MAG: ankyrin repeat domain-containing protein [Waddliaceae bacterium]